jgi:hypothetical protein
MATPDNYPLLRRIGEYLKCPQKDIDWALSVQSMEFASGNAKPLGEILVERECVAQEILARALETQRIDRLRRCSLLSDLSWEELDWIGEQTDQIWLKPGETLFKEGQRGDSAYVMLSGRLLLSQSAGDSEHPAGVVFPGDAVGEVEFIGDGTRRYTAYATELSVLLKIRYDLIPRRAGRNLRSVPLHSPDDFVGRVREVLRADRAYFFLRDPETGELTVQTDEEDAAFGFKVMAGTDIVGWVALKREVVNLPEAYLDPRFDPAMDIEMDYWTRTLLAVPVLDSGDEVLGVVEVLNKRAGGFDADDEALLHALAHQYAPSLSRYYKLP